MEFINLREQYRNISDKIQDRIQSVLNHGKFIMGPEIAELESALASFAGAKHAIAVSSGTDALTVAMMALGIGHGDEVITTPFTFIATAETIAQLGARPVFVDIRSDTYNIDPALIEEAITDRTKAIIPVSLYGQCADFDAINLVAQKYNIPVIEDGAQSFGATYNGKMSCTLSDIGTASFFPAKPLGCYGDGGACFTDDDELASKMRQIRVHGQDRRYNHPLIGLNARMDTIQAAILLEKLVIFPDEVVARARIGSRYTSLLKDVVTTPDIADGNTHVFAQYTILMDNRDDIQAKLKEKGIPTAIHYPIPLHMQPAFEYLKYSTEAFPTAKGISNKVISLPMHPYLSDQEQDLVAEAVKDALPTLK